MKVHRKMAVAVIGLAGLAGVTASAEQFLFTAASVGTPTVAAVQTSSPAAVRSGTPVRAAPIPEPTVAKVQKWVKIYSGASNKDIKAPKSIRGGSHGVELNLTPNAQIGDYLSDGAGRTLYRFDDDSAKPPKSTCNGDCATAWPPLLIKSPGKIYPKGVNPKILGYVERADGHCQVTVDGHPVYYFAGDTAPGDFRGQGLKGKWFAVTATGGRTRYLLDGEAGVVN